MAGQGLSFHQRKFSVLHLLAYQAFDNDLHVWRPGRFTIREIAVMLELKKTPYLRAVLAQLVKEDCLAMDSRKHNRAQRELVFSIRMRALNNPIYDAEFQAALSNIEV